MPEATRSAQARLLTQQMQPGIHSLLKSAGQLIARPVRGGEGVSQIDLDFLFQRLELRAAGESSAFFSFAI